MTNERRQREIHEELMRAFVGANYDVYADKWRRMDESRSAISWNWAAFFLFVGWLGYRRMYRVALIFIGVDGAEMFLEQTFDLSSSFSSLFSIGSALVLTLNANRWYRNMAEREVATLVATKDDDEAARRGLPSAPMGVAFMLLWFTVVLIGAILPTLPALLRSL